MKKLRKVCQTTGGSAARKESQINDLYRQKRHDRLSIICYQSARIVENITISGTTLKVKFSPFRSITMVSMFGVSQSTY